MLLKIMHEGVNWGECVCACTGSPTNVPACATLPPTCLMCKDLKEGSKCLQLNMARIFSKI